jgi:hypothetical protein
MRQVFEQFQVGTPPASQNPEGAINQQIFQPVTQPIKEQRTSFPKKFDITRSKFQILSIRFYLYSITILKISNKSISSWHHWNFVIWSNIIVICTIVGEKLSSS